MTGQSYSERHRAALDAGWRAWGRLGVDQWDLAFGKSSPPPIEALADAAVPRMIQLAESLLDELDEELEIDDDRRRRALTQACTSWLRGAPAAIVHAIAHEVATPDPVPFEPPPAGSWIRERWLPREPYRREPEWASMWHRFSGDLRLGGYHLRNDVYGRTTCGRRVGLRTGEFHDLVVLDERPGVDACRQCARRDAPRAPVTETVA